MATNTKQNPKVDLPKVSTNGLTDADVKSLQDALVRLTPTMERKQILGAREWSELEHLIMRIGRRLAPEPVGLLVAEADKIIAMTEPVMNSLKQRAAEVQRELAATAQRSRDATEAMHKERAEAVDRQRMAAWAGITQNREGS